MVKRLADEDNIPIIDCVGTVREISERFLVSKEWVMYCIKFNKVSNRKSGGVWLVDFHSFAQYYDLYKTSVGSVDRARDKLYP